MVQIPEGVLKKKLEISHNVQNRPFFQVWEYAKGEEEFRKVVFI